MEKFRIGVDLGGTNMAAAILNETYSVIEYHTIKTRQKATPEQLADDMAELVRYLCRKANMTQNQISMVGIGIPGSVSEDGVVEDANNIGFYRVPFESMMQERLKTSVTTVNDARAAAMGEYLAGAGKGSRTFQMVTIGTGIGGAFIVNGQVVTGCNGAAGEIGHMVIERGGIPCNCGRTGCFEAYASASALITRMIPAVLKHKESMLWELCDQQTDRLSGKLLFLAAGQKDALAERLLEEHIEYLAEGIANLINILQPDIVCVGGGMSEQKEALMAPLRRAVADKIYSKHSEVQTKLVAAALGNTAGIIGAAFSR